MVLPLLVSLLTIPTKVPSCCDPMAAFASDPEFLAAHPAPAPLRFAPQEGSMLPFKTTDRRIVNGFYVPPKTSKSPVVIMVHEWWGLNDYIKREAEWLHDKTGYAVLAIDLYDGKVATNAQDAGKFMQSVDTAKATAVVRGAVRSLKAGAFGRSFDRIGTIGWCFGGGWSHRAAIAGGPLAKACVMFYGMPDTDPADLKYLACPVLMIWARRDKWINADVVAGFKSAMSAAHRQLTVLAYDADHGFANPSNPVYNKTAADSAFDHALAFLHENLGSGE